MLLYLDVGDELNMDYRIREFCGIMWGYQQHIRAHARVSASVRVLEMPVFG